MFIKLMTVYWNKTFKEELYGPRFFFVIMDKIFFYTRSVSPLYFWKEKKTRASDRKKEPKNTYTQKRETLKKMIFFSFVWKFEIRP